MTATLEAKSTTTVVRLSDDDYNLVIDLLDRWSDNTFGRWADKGAPSDDIDCIEVRNMISALERKITYQQISTSLCDHYGCTEAQLISSAMHRYANPRRRR